MSSSLVFLLLSTLALASLAAPWSVVPMPQSISLSGGQHRICKNLFGVQATKTNEILDLNIQIFLDDVFEHNQNPTSCPSETLWINVVLESLDTGLNSTTDETYAISITDTAATITAPTVFGALHAFQTIQQLIDRSNATEWVLPNAVVKDFPRFAYRGFLHDTSRHFLPVKTLRTLIDALAVAKLNVFHWHIVDDQSFPYVSEVLPKLSLGSWGGKPWNTYSLADVAGIIRYGKIRGVRVIPEFDTPGHVASWGVGYPELVTHCYSNGKPDGYTGPLNPSLPGTFTALSQLWGEIATIFHDDYVHLGGDEVSFNCWQSNPDITKFMQAKGFGSDYAKLEQYYEQNLIKIVEATGKKYIVWQEVFDNGLDISHDTIIDVWKGGNWTAEASKVTAAGFQAILSAPFYLNYISDPYSGNSACGYVTGDWCQYYVVDPQGFPGTDAQKKLMIGGEGCMWGEYTNAANVETNTWPRAAAVAERLWSNANVKDVHDAARRIGAFGCELNRRGIRAQPVDGPSYCDYAPPSTLAEEL